MRAIAAIGMGVAMALASGVGAETRYKGYEMPPHTVELADGARELRRYGPHLLAEVTVSGSRGDAAGAGFRVLAGFIFGGNAADARIAMTVPVAQVPVGDRAARTWTLTFMMPAGWSRASLPAPADPRIRLVDDPGGRQVVERFSGLPREDDLWTRAAALRAWAEARGLRVAGGPRFYFYDGPMTLPWNRRNEVAFALAGSD
jgi:hypothetical protein